MKRKKEDEDSVMIFPSIHRFNGKTKEFMAHVNSESSLKAYGRLLKELGCKPSELSEKLRARVWKGKNPRDIMDEAEQD